MAKQVHATITEDHIVDATVDGFVYKIDWTGRKEQSDWQGASAGSVLLTSLAGCNLVTAQSYLIRTKTEYSILELDLDGEYVDVDNEDSTKLVSNVYIKTDAKLDEAGKQALLDFVDKYCTVSRVLARGNDINIELIMV